MNRLLLADDSHEISGLVFFEKLKKNIYVYFKMSSAAVPTIYVLNRNMKKNQFLSENFQLLEVKFSIYLNRRF